MYLVVSLLRLVVWFAKVAVDERTPTLTAAFMVIPVESGIPAIDAETPRSHPDRRARILVTGEWDVLDHCSDRAGDDYT